MGEVITLRIAEFGERAFSKWVSNVTQGKTGKNFDHTITLLCELPVLSKTVDYFVLPRKTFYIHICVVGLFQNE